MVVAATDDDGARGVPERFFRRQTDRHTHRQKKQDLLLEKIFQIFVFLFGPTKCREILRGNKILLLDGE